MDKVSSVRKNPSREKCEAVIKRILMTEMLEHGQNQHFKSASDFMNYFESLYPASDSLTKQVQRAVKALNMPKDENGYFIVNKSLTQVDQEKEITNVFSSAHVLVDSMEDAEPVFLSADAHLRPYILHLLNTTEVFKGKFITAVETSNGLLIYTQNRKQLIILLNSLIIQ